MAARLCGGKFWGFGGTYYPADDMPVFLWLTSSWGRPKPDDERLNDACRERSALKTPSSAQHMGHLIDPMVKQGRLPKIDHVKPDEASDHQNVHDHSHGYILRASSQLRNGYAPSKVP